MRNLRPLIAAAAVLLLAGCGFALGPAARPAMRSLEQEGFWRRLTQLCGGTYPGRMAEGADSVFLHHPLAIQVGGCTADEVRIGFTIGPDSSRSWMVRRVPGGLALAHQVRGDRITGYGGATRTPGTVARQEFAADTFTARLLPPAAQNVWWLEIDPGRTLTYGVGRPGVRRRFRLEFDLHAPSAAPRRE